MASLLKATGPFRHRNVRLYSWFAVAFNARFYYPILAILFLDLGLSIEQFVTLNAVWAATIFFAEVPSGALADIIGRRKLLVFAGALMSFEMLVLLLAPKDAGLWLFSLCIINRILSGLAEASASGADQALAYDTLQQEGEESSWEDVLATTMRWQSGAMIFAMVLGAVIYDSSFINHALHWINSDWSLSPDQTLRLPIALCLIQALTTFFISLRFTDVVDPDHRPQTSFKAVLIQTAQAAKWVFTTKMAIIIVTGGLIIDSIARNFATVNSQYFRLIQLPDYSLGFIAAGTAMLGLFTPLVSKFLVRRFSPLINLCIAAVWALLCLIALIPAWPIWGVIPAALLLASLGHVGFLISRYLNQLANSKQRATVLSVKGLLFNIGYGSISLIFAALVAHESGKLGEGNDPFLPFQQALSWQPWGFAAAFLIFLIGAKICGTDKSLEKSSAKL